MRTWLKRLEKETNLSESEKALFARSLSATPQERWEMNETYLRSLGCFSYSERKKFGFKLPG